MLDKKLLHQLEEYLNIHLPNPLLEEMKDIQYSFQEVLKEDDLEEFIKKNRKSTLNEVLFRFIDKKGTTDTEIYKKAGLDRRHFSKIRSNINYRPRKHTTIALAMALQLNKKDTDTLLSAAGYSLSESDTGDLIIQFCIEKRIYDIDLVNETLEHYDLKPICGR